MMYLQSDVSWLTSDDLYLCHGNGNGNGNNRIIE